MTPAAHPLTNRVRERRPWVQWDDAHVMDHLVENHHVVGCLEQLHVVVVGTRRHGWSRVEPHDASHGGPEVQHPAPGRGLVGANATTSLGPYRVLVEMAERKAQEGELPARRGEQEIALVARRVRPPVQLRPIGSADISRT